LKSFSHSGQRLDLPARLSGASCLARLALTALFGLAPLASWAQGGPPLVTDDPDTPGNGRWEINVAAIGAHTPGLSQLSIMSSSKSTRPGWSTIKAAKG